MSEENKTVELKEEDLERVSGGINQKVYLVCCASCNYVYSETSDNKKLLMKGICPSCHKDCNKIYVEKSS